LPREFGSPFPVVRPQYGLEGFMNFRIG